MRRIFASLAAVIAVTLGGCNLDLTNPNSPQPGGVKANPRAGSIRLIGGVLATYRTNRTDQIRAMGSFGRETYYMFITDGRFITGPLREWKLNNSFDVNTQWAGRYGNYRNEYEALKIVDSAPTTATPGLPTAFLASEKAGADGVLKTFMALDLLHAIEARGSIGIVVDITDDPTAVLPIVSEDSAYKWISAKLDEANTDLAAAGTSFYFPFYAGFGVGVTGATTPAGFSQFNRAIKARVEAKRGSLGCGAPCYTAALTALTGTWIADLTTANRDNGIFTIYSTAAGDFSNNAAFTGSLGSDLYVHVGIDSMAGVALDDRYRRKISSCPATSSRSEVGVTGNHRPCTYATTSTPIPIVRNEELVLLRAEAEWFTGATAAALADLLAVRTFSGGSNGGTSVVAFPTPANDADFVSELLLQRTLSLYQEAHRWTDYRRFGRLTALNTAAQDIAGGFTVATMLPLPALECDARTRAGNPGGIPLSCPGNAIP